MTEVPLDEPALPTPPERRPLSWLVTLLSALVLLLFAGWITWVHLTQPRLETVAAPEEALALLVARGMDFNEALARTSPWERRLHQLMTTDGSDDLKHAIAWYQELAERSLDPGVQVHLAILYGEAGEVARVEELVATWERRGGRLAVLAPVVSTAYGAATDVDEVAERAGLLESLPEGWFADRLAVAWATRVNDAALRAQASLALETRGRRLLGRARALAVISLGLAAAGVVAVVALWRRCRHGDTLAIGRAILPPLWPGMLGVVVLVRGGAGATLVIVALFFASGLLGPWFDLEHPVVEAVTWPLMYVPLLLLTRRHLLVPAGLTFADALGWRLVPGAGRRLLLMGLALAAAGGLVTMLLTLGATRLDLTSHWSEWFDEELAFGDATAIAASTVGSVVLAPFFEEVVFRGIVFATLRRGMGAGLAVLVSGAIFAIAHGYGALGFADVLASGILWAWAFEKTRSVLPGMVAHAVTNLLVSVTVLALLR